MIFASAEFFIQNNKFKKGFFSSNTTRVSDSSGPDQARHFDPVQNCLQWYIFNQHRQINKLRNMSFYGCLGFPKMPNGISHYNQLEQSISVLRVVRWYFSFLLRF